MRIPPALVLVFLFLAPALRAADYTITATSSTITVTNTTGTSDVLELVEPLGFSGEIKFYATGRTFKVNGGPDLADETGRLALPTSSITVDAGGGDDQIAVFGFSASLPALTINGGTGNDTVNFYGNLTFSSTTSSGLNVDLQNDTAPVGVDSVLISQSVNLVATANVNGSIVIRCSGPFTGEVLSKLEAANGVTVEANQQATATTGNFVGVSLDGATVRTTGSNAPISIKGRGGNDAGGSQLGVNLTNGTKIIGQGLDSNVVVTGTGGASTGQINRGVTVQGINAQSVNSAITAPSGQVTVTGTGGAAGSGFGIGVSVLNGGEISGATTTVTGIGAGTGGGGNHGVEMGGANARITSSQGALKIAGSVGANSGVGLAMNSSSLLSVPNPGGNIEITANSVSLDSSGSSISTGNPASEVQFKSTVPINLGAADTTTTLGLTDAELDRITTSRLRIGDIATTPSILISAPISPGSVTSFLTLNSSGGITPQAAGADITLTTAQLVLGAPLQLAINGTTVDTGYQQLAYNSGAATGINFNNVPLVLGGTFAGASGNVFKLVENSTGSPVSGILSGLPEGTYLPWPNNPSLVGKISYNPGAGNDVTLTLLPVTDALVVTNNADSGSGSLRFAHSLAAAASGVQTITFTPALAGGTISLASQITLNDPGGVIVDAGNLPGGITLNDGAATSYRLLENVGGSTATLRGITLSNGGGAGFTASGGAIRNDGTLTLERCTFSGNTAGNGGAIANSKILALTNCTFTANTSTGAGGTAGAIFSDPPVSGILTLAHCTCALNTSAAGGNALTVVGGLIIDNSIVANNSGGGNTSFGNGGSGNFIGGDPLLQALADNGGPTKTMAPQSNSPILDAATVLPGVDVDQRGFSRNRDGNAIAGALPDIGAFELQTATAPISGTTALAVAVTTTADEADSNGTLGAGISLREALRDAVSGGGIVFDSSLSGQTIDTGGELVLVKNVGIDARSLAAGISISGGGNHRVLSVSAGKTVSLARLKITGGFATGGFPNSYGGGIFNSGTLSLLECTLSGNSAFAGGGAFNPAGNTLTVLRSTASENNASYGGAFQNEGTLNATSSTFANNTSTVEGGAFSTPGGSPLNLVHCTVSGNTSAKGGAAIGNAVSINNSIVLGNTAPTDPNLSGSHTESGANLLSGTLILAPLNDYGGPTRTMALLPGNAARNKALFSLISFDQRGVTILGGTADLGAYEAGDFSNYNSYIYESLPGTATVGQHASTIDFDDDGQTNRQEWIASTQPGNAASVFRILSCGQDAADLLIQFTIVNGKSYTLWQSDSLGTWTNSGQPPFVGFGGNGSFRVPYPPGSGVPNRFFRVQIER